MLDAQRTGSGGLAKLGEGVRANSDAKTQAGLTRGPNLSKKLINAAWTDTFPAQGATLDLDFANDRGFVRGIGQGRSMDAVTFTRASNGNYVKPDGTLSFHANQGALGNNLLTFPQDFDNAAWTKTNATVVANVEIAIDSTNTADFIQEDTSNGAHGVSRLISQTIGQTYVFSIYAKASQREWLRLVTDDGGVARNAYFNLSTGTIGDVSAGISANISSDGNGWYRCSISRTVTTSSSNWLIRMTTADAVATYAGDGESGIFIWGAQLELGSSATEYFPTNIGQPRFDWASTVVVAQKNLLSYTEQFDNAYWSKFSLTVSANFDNAPDGTITADKLIPTAISAEHHANRTVSDVITETSRLSVYAKSAGYDWLQIQLGGGSVQVNLSSGVLFAGNRSGTSDVSAQCTIDAVGSGWYRITGPTTAGSVRFYPQENQNVFNYLADGSSGTLLWGAQLELGDTATTYQPIAQPTTSTPLAANPASNGLLIEEARTNRILWCRDATDAAWVKTNVTAAKDQTGVDGVANAASSLTATANDGTCIQTITLVSGSRTGSVYLKRITGTGNVQVSLNGTTYSTVDLSDTEWRRIVLSGTVTNPTVGIKLAVSGDAVAMDYGQVEDGAYVTTPILTTTATATRSADVATVDNNVQNIFNPAKFAIAMTFGVRQYTGASSESTILSLGDRTSGGFISLFRYDHRGFFATYAGNYGAVGEFQSGQYTISTAYTSSRAAIYLSPYSSYFESRASVDINATTPKVQIGIGCRVRNFVDIVSTSTVKRLVFLPKEISATATQELLK